MDDTGNFVDLCKKFQDSPSMEQRCAVLKEITADQEIIKEAIFHPKQLEDLIDDTMKTRES